MAVQSSFYSGVALGSRTFPTTKHIATKQHMAVWLRETGSNPIVWTQMKIEDFELINNSAVLVNLVSAAVYDALEIRVADEPNELVDSPSDLTIVAAIADEIVVVAGIADEVVSVAGNEVAIAKVGAEPLATNITKVADIDTDVSSVAAISGDVAGVNAISADVVAVNTDPLKQSILDAPQHATNAAQSATSSSNYASTSQVRAWESEAEKMTSDSYATEPENVFVKTYTSDGDGTFTATNTIEYSSLHWAAKAQGSVTPSLDDLTDVTITTPSDGDSLVYDNGEWINGSSNDLTGAIGNINSPLLDLPLNNSLAMKQGVGSVTFTRASTATYVDRYGVVKTAAIDEPRFEKEGLLIEGGSTNMILYSEDFTNAVWELIGTTKTDNYGVAPDGTNTSAIINFTDESQELRQLISISEEDASFSIWLKGSIGSECRITIVGSNSPTAAISFTDDKWNRYEVGALTATTRIMIDTYGRNTISPVEVWGAQLEALPFASSYIKTEASPVARIAERMSVTYNNNTPQQNADQTFMADVSILGKGTYNQQDIMVIQGEIRRSVWFDKTTELLNFGLGNAGISNTSITYGSMKRYAVSRTIGNQQVTYANGVEFDSRTTSNVTGTATGEISIGSNVDASSNSVYMHIKNIRWYDQSLSAQEIKIS